MDLWFLMSVTGCWQFPFSDPLEYNISVSITVFVPEVSWNHAIFQLSAMKLGKFPQDRNSPSHLVKQRYATQLKDCTLASIREEISGCTTELLVELGRKIHLTFFRQTQTWDLLFHSDIVLKTISSHDSLIANIKFLVKTYGNITMMNRRVKLNPEALWWSTLKCLPTSHSPSLQVNQENYSTKSQTKIHLRHSHCPHL